MPNHVNLPVPPAGYADGMKGKEDPMVRRSLAVLLLLGIFAVGSLSSSPSPPTSRSRIGAGPDAWFGWPKIPQLEKLTTYWLHATDQTKRKKLAEDIQRITLGEVAYVPWGEWIWPTAFRKNVHGILKFTAPLFWNVTIT